MMIGKITRKLHRIRSFKLRKEEKGTKRLLLNIIFSVGLATFLALSANAICSFAGEEQPDYRDENGVNYFINDNTAYVGPSGGAQGDIYIQPTITVNEVDYNVTSIRNGAFTDNEGINGVYLSASIETIGDLAFKNCTNLQNINIPSSVTTIGADAFTGTNLSSITVTLGFDFTKFENSGIIVKETDWGGKIFSVKDTSINEGDFYVENPSGSFGDNGNNLEWSIYEYYDYKKGQNIYCLGITGTGDMDDFDDQNPAPWASYSSIIAKVILPDDITKIGANAFSGCVGLTKINIPASVTSVGNNAFSGCTDLTNIFIKDNDNDTLNLSDTGIENDAIIWKYKAKGSMGEKTLISLSGKKADGEDIPSNNPITIYCDEVGENYEINLVPQGVILKHNCDPFNVEIGEITWSCRRLEGNNVSIRPYQNTITGDVIIPSTVQFSNLDFTVTAIMDNAFERCSNLQSIKIPKNVTSIGMGVFSGSINLKEIKVDSENTAYVSDDGVLYNKDKTTLICYPEGKEGDSFTIPASVTKIELAAISSCQYLKTVNFAEGTQIEEIGNGAFAVNIEKQLSSSVKTVNIPARVTKIGSGAFMGCTNLENVNFEENSQLKEIGNAAFVMCTSLKNINLPESVATIGKDEKDPVMGAEGMVFGACSGLESITIPKNVTTIGKFSFLECSSLADVYVKDGLDVSGAGIQDSANIWRYAVLPEEQQTIQGKTLVQIPSVTKGDGSAISGSISLSSTDMGDKYLIEEVECCATGDKTNGWTVYGAHNYEIEYNWTEEENGSWKCTEKKTCKNGCGETETESMIITPYNGMYDGNEHSAVANISGEISGATISYSTDNSTWNSEVPKYKEVGTYTIYVKVQNNEDERIFGTQQMVVTIKEYEPGDINKSGEVDVIDLQMLYNHVTENSVITDEEQLKLANINNDSYIDVLDLQALFNIIASS